MIICRTATVTTLPMRNDSTRCTLGNSDKQISSWR